MRVALVSPYSWTYPGGVTRHIEALAAELLAAGHDVRVFAPFDRDTRATALLHRGARPQARESPDWLVPARRHDRLAVERRGLQPRADARPRSRRCAASCAPSTPDVVHLHEPVAPGRRLGRADEHRRAARRHVPLLLGVACRRTRSPRCSARAASSTTSACASRSPRPRPGPAGASTAATTGSSPTASRCRRAASRAARCARRGDPLRIVFVGQAVERKGLPVLLRAFEALRAQVPAELTIVGVDAGGDRAAARGRRRRDRARPRRRRGPPRRARAAPTCCARRRWAASRSGWC